MPKETGTRRELWIAREVTCNSSETVSVLWRLSIGKGEDTEFLIELASGSKWRQVAQTWKNTNANRVTRVGHRHPPATLDFRRPRRTVCENR